MPVLYEIMDHRVNHRNNHRIDHRMNTEYNNTDYILEHTKQIIRSQINILKQVSNDMDKILYIMSIRSNKPGKYKSELLNETICFHRWIYRDWIDLLEKRESCLEWIFDLLETNQKNGKILKSKKDDWEYVIRLSNSIISEFFAQNNIAVILDTLYNTKDKYKFSFYSAIRYISYKNKLLAVKDNPNDFLSKKDRLIAIKADQIARNINLDKGSFVARMFRTFYFHDDIEKSEEKYHILSLFFFRPLFIESESTLADIVINQNKLDYEDGQLYILYGALNF